MTAIRLIHPGPLAGRGWPLPFCIKASPSSLICAKSNLHGFVDSRDALAPADAHGDKCILASDAAQLVQGLHRQDTARCPNGVTKRDATPVWVRAIHRQVQIAHEGQ